MGKSFLVIGVLKDFDQERLVVKKCTFIIRVEIERMLTSKSLQF